MTEAGQSAPSVHHQSLTHYIHAYALPGRAYRHARVTVKYNRKELQRRLEVEKWIDERLDQLYSGQLNSLNYSSFIRELVEKLNGMHKQEVLQTVGIEHPAISHSHYRHEPYHFNNPHHREQPALGPFHDKRKHNVTRL
uniref:Uncharacterized protein n=1 Tax=Neogobius melanostomus TaxID=47308 RepID=A0A8C6TDE2_9GOBI